MKNNKNNELYIGKELTKRYLTLILIFLFIFLLIIYLTLSHFIFLNFRSDLNKKIEFFIEIIVPYLTEHKFYELENFITHFNENEKLKYIFLYDKSDIILLYSIKNYESNKSFFKKTFTISKNFIYKKKLNNKDIHLELKALIGFDMLNFVYNLLLLKFLFITFYLSLSFGIISLFNFTNEKVIYKNLRRIINIIEDFSKGDFSKKYEIVTNDELGIIAREFNIMKEELLKNIEILNYIFYYNNSLCILTERNGTICKINKNYSILFPKANSENDIIGSNIISYLDEFNLLFEQIEGSKNVISINNITFNKEELANYSYKVVILPIIINDKIDKVYINIDEISEEIKNLNNIMISQKIESLNLLSAGIAHDFNNILGTINGAVKLIKTDIEANDIISKNELNEYISILENSINKGENLSKRLLRFSKDQKVKKKNFDLNELIKNIVNIIYPSFDKSVKINVKYYPEPAIFYGDENEIEQVFINICINAYHAMTIMRPENNKTGGVLNISINKTNYRKEYAFSIKKNPYQYDDREYWIISFEDTGVGIKKEFLNKIFDPLFTTKKNEKGTGLGLYIAYNVVKKHEGFISVYSEENIGTKFNIYLPVKTNTEEFDKKIDSFSKVEPERFVEKTCVIVEDDKIILENICRLLENLNLKILYKSNDEEDALNFIFNNNEKIDMVIVDNHLQKITGIEFIQKLIENNSYSFQKTKIIIISGFIINEDFTKFIQKKINIYTLIKPFGIEELKELLSKIFK